MKKPVTLAERKGLKASSSATNVAIPNVPYPIDDYAKLIQNVQLWCDRDDEEFVNQIPNFIDFAQKDIYRNLRITPMLKEAYTTISAGIISLPTDYLQSDNMYFAANYLQWRETSPDEVSEKLNSVGGDEILTLSDIVSRDIEPIYARQGKRIFTYPRMNVDVPVQAGGFTGEIPEDAVVMSYYADEKRMTAGTDDPYLLEIAPDLFTFATIVHAANFCQAFDVADRAAKQADKIYKSLVEQEKQMDYNTPLVVPMANINSYW